MFGLFGVNGVGKMMIFWMILGFLSLIDGNIRWKGQLVNYFISEKIGYFLEEWGLYLKVRVSDQFVYFVRLKGMRKKDVEKEFIIWFEWFGIIDYKNKKVEELLKGNQQKIQFIFVVLYKFELLIFDEFFSGFDLVNVELLKEVVIFLKNSGVFIVFFSY